MFRMTTRFCVNASPARAWQVLSDVKNIHQWVPAIRSVDCETEQVRGEGTVRICHLDKFDMREQFLEWEEGRGFKYVGTGAPMVEWASNRWTIEPLPHNPRQCLIRSDAEIALKGAIFGRLLEPVMWLYYKLLLPNSGAPLKYLIENNRPYQGEVSDLPAAPVAC